MTPGWIADLLAALMLAVAAASAYRLLAFRLLVFRVGASRPRGLAVSTEVGHLLMGMAMAGSLASSLAIAPGRAWAVVIALLTAWLGWRAWRVARIQGLRVVACGQCAPHLAHAVAMLYMLIALTGRHAAGIAAMSASAGGSASAQHPTISFVLGVICVGYCVWDLDQLSGRRYRRLTVGDPGADKGTRALLLSPAMEVACRVAMGVTMSFMLLTML